MSRSNGRGADALLFLARVVVGGQLVDDEDMLLVCVNAQHVGAVNLHTSCTSNDASHTLKIHSNHLKQIKSFRIALRNF